MNSQPESRITKTDFLTYREAPRHLWAQKHGAIVKTLSDFDQHLIKEGYHVEKLAHEYLQEVSRVGNPEDELHWQKTFISGPFETRVDALIYKQDSQTYDLYEIKSTTNPDKADLFDIAFQALTLKDQIKVDHYYLMYLNKEYIRQGELDLSQLFIADDLTERVIKLQPEIAE